jgi:CDP-diglyceride synthetase
VVLLCGLGIFIYFGLFVPLLVVITIGLTVELLLLSGAPVWSTFFLLPIGYLLLLGIDKTWIGLFSLLLFSLLTLGINISQHYRQDPRFPARRYMGVLVFGVLLIVLFFAEIRPFFTGDPQTESYFILALMIPIWLTDSSAYFIGRWLKGPKLCPRISPHKTWSGALGGLIIASLGVWFFRHFWGHETFFFMFLIPLSAMLGDLAVSWGKRCLQIKDTSNLIPGHGGIWDRLDSLLGVIFMLWIWNLFRFAN